MNELSLTWYRRVGEIPGFDYQPFAEPQTDALWGANAVPAIDSDHEGNQYLRWPKPEDPSWHPFNTAPSIVAAAAFRTNQMADTLRLQQLLGRCSAALELPGTAEDYNFVFERAQHQLWRRWRQDLAALKATADVGRVHFLFLLSLGPIVADLIRGGPVEYPVRQSGWAETPAVIARLIDLFADEGMLSVARPIADVASKWTPGLASKFDEINLRMERLGVRHAA